MYSGHDSSPERVIVIVTVTIIVILVILEIKSSGRMVVLVVLAGHRRLSCIRIK